MLLGPGRATMAIEPDRCTGVGMGRIAGLTVVAALALAAFFHGVVLNGWGLFGEPGETPEVAKATAPAEPARRDEKSAPAAPAPVGAPEPDRTAEAHEPSAPIDIETPVESAPVEETPPLRAARNVTPPNVLSRPTSRYRDPAEETATEEPKSEIRRFHRVVVRDAATLEADDLTIRFAGIVPIEGERSCTDENGQVWPCGRAAAAALRMLIRHRAVDCTVVSESADGIVGTCSVGLQNLNGWLVEQGWAEADTGAGYGEEADAARAGKRGIYLARWEPKGEGGSGEVPDQAFTAPAIPPDLYSNVPVAGPPESPVN